MNTGTVASNAAATLDSIAAPITVAGGLKVSATNTIFASATGIDGDAGAGSIRNSGAVQANASAELLRVNVEHNLVDNTRGALDTVVEAETTGIDTADGSGWTLTNQGTVGSVATASSNNTNIEINLADAAVADVSLEVSATASALRATGGAGTIANTGDLSVLASAESTEISANLSYLDITLVDPEPADGGSTITATGTGIDGGHATGALTIDNSATINATSDAFAEAITIALASEGTPQGLKALYEGIKDGDIPIAGVGITTSSTSIGVASGGGADVLGNTGRIEAHADSEALQHSINVGVSLIDWKIPTPGIVLGSAGTEAFAVATGLDAGAGNDRISNSSTVLADSHAIARAETVSANISGFTDSPLGSASIPLLGSLGASLALADTTNRAHADAAGLRGNDGNDMLSNSGGITANATAEGGAISVAATVNVKYKEGENLFGANAVGARATTLVEATAIGIDGGFADYQKDKLEEKKPVLTRRQRPHHQLRRYHRAGRHRCAQRHRRHRSGGFGEGRRATFNLAATDTSALGFAIAHGVDGGIGNDQITNTGNIDARAQVETNAASASLGVSFAKSGISLGVALARAEALADATAIGLHGGAGADAMLNSQRVAAHAHADTLAVAVAVTLSGTVDGLALGASVADASGDAFATAIGLDGGADDDVLRNDNVVEISDVTAEALAASIGLQVSGTNNGIAAGVSIANSSANATATAIGLAGGAGNDGLINTGGITLRNVDADSNADSIAVTLTGTLNAGVAAGVAMTDSSTHSNVVATGISGGEGNDSIHNTGTITANDGIETDAGTVSASLELAFSMAGGALGAALSRQQCHGRHPHHRHRWRCRQRCHRQPRRHLAVRHRGCVRGQHCRRHQRRAGLWAAAPRWWMPEANATSTLTGIDGGTGRNDIANSAGLQVSSESNAQALAVGVSVALAAGADYAAVDTQAFSTATAIGIGEAGSPGLAGERGSILNTGQLDISADASVTGTSIVATLRGMSLGETSITALAEGFGIRSGAGANLIDNRGLINVTSHANAGGLAVQVTAAGKAAGELNTTAEARATGIAAGDGDDLVQNSAGIILAATSISEAEAVSVTLAGTARTEVRADAITMGIGIDGGGGDDQLVSTADLDILVRSKTQADDIDVAVAGTTGSDVVNAPVSSATAMAGGDGKDVVMLGGAMVSVIADSDATVKGSSWTVAGTSGSRAGVEAGATALGLDGGSGDDTLVQRAGSLNIAADAYADVNSTAWTFFGSSGSEAALSARTRALGLDGGAGADLLRNETAFTATSTATLVATGGDGTMSAMPALPPMWARKPLPSGCPAAKAMTASRISLHWHWTRVPVSIPPASR